MRKFVLAAMAGLGMAAGASLMSAAPAAAGGLHAVCMQGPQDVTDCRYDSFAQCSVTASGLGADCQINPFYAAYAQGRPYYDEPDDGYPAPRRVRRHHHRAY